MRQENTSQNQHWYMNHFKVPKSLLAMVGTQVGTNSITTTHHWHLMHEEHIQGPQTMQKSLLYLWYVGVKQ